MEMTNSTWLGATFDVELGILYCYIHRVDMPDVETDEDRIKLSIEKFEFVKSLAIKYQANVRWMGRDTCPLCWKYNYDSIQRCIGCPIYEKTKEPYCRNTPYIDSSKLEIGYENVVTMCEAEIEFLKGFLKNE